ncbi:MAG: hypothetical protein U1F40_07100 [Turneriella sp.]
MKWFLPAIPFLLLLLPNCSGQNSLSDRTRDITINDSGIGISGGAPTFLGDGPVYQNTSVPQDFSLPMPVLTGATDNTIDLGRCYMDYAPAATNLDAQTRRLCGLQFTQIQLELRALFLDLALPDIRAYCRNKLADCQLSGQAFTITVSEPVMRRVQQLFEFYKYTGLEAYFQYNGYEIRNGAKIPFTIDEYNESCQSPYDYRAVIRTRVIGTYGGQAEVRDNAGDVVIYWDKPRHHIAMDFRTVVDLFGFRINLRRTYEYADRLSGVKYTSSVNYWQQGSTLVNANAVVAEPCSNANADCVKFRHLAGEFLGNDTDLGGLEAHEAFYDAQRFSEGIADARGGIIDSYASYAGSVNKERLVFTGKNQTDFLFQSVAGQPLALVLGDSAAIPGNTYLASYGQQPRLGLTLAANLYAAAPFASRSLAWLATGDAREITSVRGLAVAGSSGSWSLRWGNGTYQQGDFAFDGAQVYRTGVQPADALHPLY